MGMYDVQIALAFARAGHATSIPSSVLSSLSEDSKRKTQQQDEDKKSSAENQKDSDETKKAKE